MKIPPGYRTWRSYWDGSIETPADPRNATSRQLSSPTPPFSIAKTSHLLLAATDAVTAEQRNFAMKAAKTNSRRIATGHHGRSVNQRI